MTKVQARALQIWVVILWTALWCWAYGNGWPRDLLHFVFAGKGLICFLGWAFPFAVIAGSWRGSKQRQLKSGRRAIKPPFINR